MSYKISDLKEEIKDLNFNISIANWDMNHRYDFINGILTILSRWTGNGMGYFWNEKYKNSTFQGWMECLECFSAKTLLEMVQLILDGKYRKGDDSIPRSPMDFKHFVMHGTHSQIPKVINDEIKVSIDKNLLLSNAYDNINRREKSEKIAQENLQKIRAIVKRAMSKNKMDLDFPIKTEEELKEIYRSNREAPLIFCNKHGLYDYKDRGCCKCRTG